MRIRDRLTLLYVVVVALLLLCLNVYIYYFINLHTNTDFFSKLNERALIAAELFLEKDEVDPAAFKQIENKYVKSLPSESVLIFDSSNTPRFESDSEKVTYTADILQKIRQEKNVEFWEGQKQIVGMSYSDNQGDFVVVVSAVNLHGLQRVNFLLLILITGFILSLVVVYFSARIFSKIVLKPISDIVHQVNQVKASNLRMRVNEGNGKDEIAELAITFNNLLTRLEKAFNMEKEFVHNASHELRTPLTSIIGEIEVALKKARTEEEYKLILDSVLQDTQQLSKLTTSLLHLAQANIDETELIKEEVRIDELLWEAKEFVIRENPSGDIRLEYVNLPDDSKPLNIKVNKQLLLSAITNIMENACKYSGNKPVKVILKIKSHSRGISPQIESHSIQAAHPLSVYGDLIDGSIQIDIIDQGIGIQESERENVFKSFYRAEKTHAYGGFGIGLALAQKIISLHNGTIKVLPANPGTRFCIELPLKV